MDHRPARRQSAARELKAAGLDALLVTSPTNVRYLSGFGGEAAYLALTPKKVVLVTDARFSDQAAEECRDIEVVIRPHTQTLDQAAAATLGKLKARTVGLEGSTTLATAESLAGALPAATFTAVHGVVEKRRAVKDAGELAQIRHAIAVAERAFRSFVPHARAADSEKDLHDAMEAMLRRAGAVCGSFPPITAVGERAARPHAVPDPGVRLDSAGLLLIDWGADCGYVSDLTRTVKTPFGPARKPKSGHDFDTVYRLVCAAQDAAAATVRAGVAAKDVDAAARKVFAAQKLDDKFTHGLGHGIGLDVHELPRVRADSTCTLEVGNVITLEPALYFPGWGGIRIEDDYLVTETGCERLSTLPRDPELLL